MSTERSNGFREAVDHVSKAIARITSGEASAYIDCWALNDDDTLFGAWGPIEKGHKQVTDTFKWVGSRFSGPGLESEIVVSTSSGDIGYTGGFERGPAGIDGGPERPMTIRVTHIYHRGDNGWKLVHHHADFPPLDPRK